MGQDWRASRATRRLAAIVLQPPVPCVVCEKRVRPRPMAALPDALLRTAATTTILELVKAIRCGRGRRLHPAFFVVAEVDAGDSRAAPWWVGAAARSSRARGGAAVPKPALRAPRAALLEDRLVAPRAGIASSDAARLGDAGPSEVGGFAVDFLRLPGVLMSPITAPAWEDVRSRASRRSCRWASRWARRRARRWARRRARRWARRRARRRARRCNRGQKRRGLGRCM